MTQRQLRTDAVSRSAWKERCPLPVDQLSSPEGGKEEDLKAHWAADPWLEDQKGAARDIARTLCGSDFHLCESGEEVNYL